MKKYNLFFLVSVLSFLLFACSNKRGEDAQGETVDTTPVIYVTNYPMQYFAETIAGDLMYVRFPASGSGDPAYWKPTPEEIADMQKADLVLLNGAGYEQWLKGVTLPPSRVFDSMSGLQGRLIEEEGTITHSHGGEGEHTHGEIAFTTWLDLSLANEQARAVKDKLSRRWPEYKAQFDNGYAKLEADLLALDETFRNITSRAPKTAVFFSHPVYQYFQRRYKVNGRSVHWVPDQIPGEEMMKVFRHELEHQPAAWMIWEDAPLPETLAVLEEMGIKSVVFQPCGDNPPFGDFLKVMQQNATALEKIYTAQ